LQVSCSSIIQKIGKNDVQILYNDLYRFGFYKEFIGNMHRIWLYIFLVIVEQNIFVQSEVFTSITHITQLLDTEIELAKRLKVYLEREHERLDRVQK
jgi:hypothetical protein